MSGPSGRLKVLFAISTMDGGGAEKQVATLLQHLDRDRFEPHLWLLRREGVRLAEVPDDVPIHAFIGGEKRRRWVRGLSRVAAVRHLASVLHRQQIDVLYDRTFLTTLLTAPATRLAGAQRVSAAVNDPQAEWDTHVRMLGGLQKRYARWCYRSADVVTANSDDLRDRMIAFFGLDPARVRVVRNAIDFDAIARNAARDRPTLDPDRFHVVAAGRLHRQKGFDVLIEAIARVPEIDGRQIALHILGEGTERPALQDQSERLGIADRVVLHGFVDNPPAWFAAADLFALSSRSEGCPNALIEALACGVPCVSIDCPSGPREVLADGRFGKLVPVGDVERLAEALRNPPKRQTADGRPAHLSELFSADASTHALETLFQRVSRRASD